MPKILRSFIVCFPHVMWSIFKCHDLRFQAVCYMQKFFSCDIHIYIMWLTLKCHITYQTMCNILIPALMCYPQLSDAISIETMHKILRPFIVCFTQLLCDQTQKILRQFIMWYPQLYHVINPKLSCYYVGDQYPVSFWCNTGTFSLLIPCRIKGGDGLAMGMVEANKTFFMWYLYLYHVINCIDILLPTKPSAISQYQLSCVTVNCYAIAILTIHKILRSFIMSFSQLSCDEMWSVMHL